MKTIGYVLADFPVFSETFVGNEMRAMQSRGHQVIPIVMRLRTGPAQQADRIMSTSAALLSTVAGARPLQSALFASRDATKALTFIVRQTRLPRLSLFWNAMKIVMIARNRGCEHLHAHFSGGAAAHAIVAARWLGISVSFVCHGHDVYAEAEDLELKLRSADTVVAVCEDMAADLRRLAPAARIVTITCGTDPEKFRPSTDSTKIPRLLFVGRSRRTERA